MSFHYSRTVVGYHGCDIETANRILEGQPFKESRNQWDWLGRGVYFWEYGPNRAFEWAEAQAHEGAYSAPAVIGAMIHLGTCFDLLDTGATRALNQYYRMFKRDLFENLGRPMPTNRGATPDKKARLLDCAVINSYLELLDSTTGTRFDTVRGMFQEGGPAFPGGSIFSQSHIQIAVRNPASIIGVFRPSTFTVSPEITR